MTRLDTEWSSTLILESILMAFLGSYSAVCLTELYRVSRRMNAKFFGDQSVLIFSALAVGGSAIWCMHFVGMGALSLKTPDGIEVNVKYNLGLTILSFVCAVVCVYWAMYVSTRDTIFILSKDEICKLIARETKDMKTARNKYILVKHFLLRNLTPIVLSGFIAALGVCLMHYIGMMAMECDAVIIWNPGVVAASVLVAVAVASIGFWILFRLLALYSSTESLRALSAIVITVAVCAVHYIGMAAATYEMSDQEISMQNNKSMTASVSAKDATRTALFVNIIFNYAISMACQGELRSCYYRLLKFEAILRHAANDCTYKTESFAKKYRRCHREHMKDFRKVMSVSNTGWCPLGFLDRSSAKIADFYNNDEDLDDSEYSDGSKASRNSIQSLTMADATDPVGCKKSVLHVEDGTVVQELC